MNPPSHPPSPAERSRDQEELVKFYMLNKMTYNYLVALGFTIEAENVRQTVNLNPLQCLTSLALVDELLQYVTVQQQQPPNIDAQLFPTLADAIKNGTTTTINAAATSAIGSATVPSFAGPPPNIAPTLPLAGSRIVNIGASPANILPVNAPDASTMGSATVPSCAVPPNISPRLPLAGGWIGYNGLPIRIAPNLPLVRSSILNHPSLGNTSMGCHFPVVAAQQHTQFFFSNMIPTPGAVRIIDNASIMRYQQLQQRQHRHKILSQRNLGAVVQNHTAIQGSKRARPDTFSTAESSTNRPRTDAISSSSASAIIAGCTTDLSDTSDISSPATSDQVAGCTSHIGRLHIA